MATVLSGVFGAVLAFCGVLLGVWLKSRSDQRSWLRDQKLAGAAEVVSAGSSIYELRSGSGSPPPSVELDEVREWQARLQKGRAVIHLLCTQETRDRADRFARSCWQRPAEGDGGDEHLVAALREFTTALRDEIGSR